MRRIPFLTGEYYHIYNRGVDKRVVFGDKLEFERFFQSMNEFNTVEPVGSLYLNRFNKTEGAKEDRLVDFVAYCLNPNHYHLILTPLAENGIEKFMQRLGTGYTMFFNEKHKRTGSLFQGRFKSIHIDSDEYLMYLNVYVNLNNKVHKIDESKYKDLVKSSWEEYIGYKNSAICNKEIVLDRFNSGLEYKNFAEETLRGILERKDQMSSYLME